MEPAYPAVPLTTGVMTAEPAGPDGQGRAGGWREFFVCTSGIDPGTVRPERCAQPTELKPPVYNICNFPFTLTRLARFFHPRAHFAEILPKLVLALGGIFSTVLAKSRLRD